MPAIHELVHTHAIAVIEDCAQTHGARIRGQSVGSFGDVAAWS
jgi:dTDP-4-amino-4,6-dideoxygalactose transaminase